MTEFDPQTSTARKVFIARVQFYHLISDCNVDFMIMIFTNSKASNVESHKFKIRPLFPLNPQ